MDQDLKDGLEQQALPAPATLGMVAAPALLLSACGGSTSGLAAASAGAPASAAGAAVVTSSASGASTAGILESMQAMAGGATVLASPAISDVDAARFLAQASIGADRNQIAQVQALGFAGWIDAQMAMPQSTSRWDWLMAKGYNAATNIFTESGFDAAVWRKLISSPDSLRQRVTLALSELLVVAIDGLSGAGWRSFAAAGYLDLLESNCFGNYRKLLYAVSKSPAMGQYLTFAGSAKFNAATGAGPDENYAREVMQLFSIGLLQLNLDGTPKTSNGAAIETYGLADITGLARIFTGWDFDRSNNAAIAQDFVRRPMIQVAARHETGASTFLGSTVPAGLNGEQSLNAALDIIFAHPNVAPFVSRQLIQRLISSNPSPAYVSRIATVFNNDGKGVRGNLAAVVKAILLDPEARSTPQLSNPQIGKLREPMLRMLAWARAWHLASASDSWPIGNTSDPASRLGQSPSRSPTVFNFFWPGYVPPNTSLAAAKMVAPEFQITNESTVIGYLNFMQRLIATNSADLAPDYSSLLALAGNAAALLAEINTVLAAGQLSNSTLNNLIAAVNSMPTGSTARLNNRVYAALLLVMAAPEFIVLK